MSHIIRTIGKAGLLLLLWALVVTLQVAATRLPTAGIWEPAGEPMPAIAALALDHGRLLAGGRDGLFESTDEAASWSAVPEMRGRPVTALVMEEHHAAAAGPDGLWVEREDGWNLLPPAPGGAVRRLAILDNRLLAASEAGLFGIPLDGTGSWIRLWPAPGQPSAATHAVLVAGNHLLLGTDDGVVETDGDGREEGSLGPAGARILDIKTGGAWVHIAIAGPNGGLARAEAGSDRWQHGLVDSEYATTVLVDPRDSSRLYAALGGQATDRYLAGVVLSEDGGLTWAPVRNRLLNSFVPALAVDARQGTLYAGTLGGGVYRYRVPTPLHFAVERARPVLEVADLLLLGLAAVAVLLRVRSAWAKRREPQSPSAT